MEGVNGNGNNSGNGNGCFRVEGIEGIDGHGNGWMAMEWMNLSSRREVQLFTSMMMSR